MKTEDKILTEGKYILDGKTPIPCNDLMEWARWFETANRHVDKTRIGEIYVSTVFLGMDHSFFGGPPILFETMVFGGDEDGYQERYSTWEEAVKGHADVCKKLSGSN